jgi:hypothetical protein
MSSASGLLRAIAARIAQVLSFEGHSLGRRATEMNTVDAPAERAAAQPPETEYSEREIEDREREIRILMAMWM